jgi:hypothetical protein
MERSQLFDLMGELKLYGMKTITPRAHVRGQRSFDRQSGLLPLLGRYPSERCGFVGHGVGQIIEKVFGDDPCGARMKLGIGEL